MNTIDGALTEAVGQEEKQMSQDDVHTMQRQDDLGHQEPYRTIRKQSQRKSVVLACILSAMPGLGQIYVGYYQRGFLHVLAFASIIALLASGQVAGLQPFLGISLAFLVLYNIVDAGRRAALYNLALDGLSLEPLPEDMMGNRGSLMGGTILIVAGVLLFAHLRFDMSLVWLEEWWPLGLVALGAHLVVQARRERSNRE